MIIGPIIGGGDTTGSTIPDFTYTGNYALVRNNIGWVLRLLTSGDLVFRRGFSADVFCCGGGGGAANRSGNYGGGGGGAYTIYSSVPIDGGSGGSGIVLIRAHVASE